MTLIQPHGAFRFTADNAILSDDATKKPGLTLMTAMGQFSDDTQEAAKYVALELIRKHGTAEAERFGNMVSRIASAADTQRKAAIIRGDV